MPTDATSPATFSSMVRWRLGRYRRFRGWRPLLGGFLGARNSPSASPYLPWFQYTLARLARVLANSGWSRPSAFSLIASARRKSPLRLVVLALFIVHVGQIVEDLRR